LNYDTCDKQFFSDPIPTASELECALAGKHGRLVWDGSQFRIYSWDGKMYVLEPLEEEEKMEEFDKSAQCRDYEDARDIDEAEAACPDPDCDLCDTLDPVEQALFDALILGAGNIRYVSPEEMLEMYPQVLADPGHIQVEPPFAQPFKSEFAFDLDKEVDAGPENQERIVEDMRISDVSGYEVSRKYIYPDAEVVISEPWRVFIAPSGSHRVQQLDGTVNYIPPGWKVLQWTPADINDPVKF